MSDKKHILITGGAGYIGSLLTSELLRAGSYVTVVDNLLYGGESLLGFLAHPDFHFTKADVTEPGSVSGNWKTGGLEAQCRGRKTCLRTGFRSWVCQIRVRFHLQYLWPLNGRKSGNGGFPAHTAVAVC
jgi:hypothetical protein